MIAYCLLHTISSTLHLSVSPTLFQYYTILFPLRSVVGSQQAACPRKFSFPQFLASARAHRVKRMNGIVGHVKWMILCHILLFGCGETVILLLPRKPIRHSNANRLTALAILRFRTISIRAQLRRACRCQITKREREREKTAEKCCVCL